MTDKKFPLVSTLKKIESAFVDLVQNERGKEAYDQAINNNEDWPMVDLDNFVDRIATGYYSAITLDLYDMGDEKTLKKFLSSKDNWIAPLPIVHLGLAPADGNQIGPAISALGSDLTSLEIEISNALELDVIQLLTACPKLSKLVLKGFPQSGARLSLNGLESSTLIELDILVNIEAFKIDLSKTALRRLACETLDLSGSRLPPSLRELSINALQGEKLEVGQLQDLDTLAIRLDHNSQTTDLSSIAKLKKLHHLEISLEGDNDISLGVPAALESMRLRYGHDSLVDLAFLSQCPQLKRLQLWTDVYNGFPGFKGIASIKSLSQLEALDIDEKGMGRVGFKSEINPEYLEGMSKLQSIRCTGLLTLKDLTTLSRAVLLEEIFLDSTTITSLKGIEVLSAIRSIIMVDCNELVDLAGLAKSKVTKFHYSTSEAWAGPAKVSKAVLITLANSNLTDIEFDIKKIKWSKKELDPFEKAGYEVDVYDTCVSMIKL